MELTLSQDKMKIQILEMARKQDQMGLKQDEMTVVKFIQD